MPVKLSNMIGKVAKVTLDYGDDGDLNIQYYPNFITQEVLITLNCLQEMQESQMKEAFKQNNDLIAKIIKSWDILDDNGDSITIDNSTLTKIPVSVMQDVIRAIMDDMQGEAKAPKRKK